MTDNLHHLVLSLSHYCYHVDFFIVGIVEDNSSNSNKYQNCINPKGIRSTMVGPAGAHLFKLWEGLAPEFAEACSFLDVAVITGEPFSGGSSSLISFHNPSRIFLIVGRYLIRL
jgi:hypothetical protein